MKVKIEVENERPVSKGGEKSGIRKEAFEYFCK